MLGGYKPGQKLQSQFTRVPTPPTLKCGERGHKCQNQNLADSNSPIAKDLRREVYELLHQGKADIEIMNYMVARYGDFVLYRPRVNSLTYVLWFGPAVLILIGVLVVVFIVRRKPIERKKVELSVDEKDKLTALLKDKDL